MADHPIMLRQPLTYDECQIVREWRNAPDVLPALRTGPKTRLEQAVFYEEVILAPPPRKHEYYAIIADGNFIGMGGLTHLDGSSGEISVILGPGSRTQGFGAVVVDALLRIAKDRGLASVSGECLTGGNLAFWAKQLVRRPANLRWEWSL